MIQDDGILAYLGKIDEIAIQSNKLSNHAHSAVNIQEDMENPLAVD